MINVNEAVQTWLFSCIEDKELSPSKPPSLWAYAYINVMIKTGIKYIFQNMYVSITGRKELW